VGNHAIAGVTGAACRPIGKAMADDRLDDATDGPAGGRPDRPLRRGWTTGACATAAAKAAYTALRTGVFPDPIEITLPRGERPAFTLALTRSDAAGDGGGHQGRR